MAKRAKRKPPSDALKSSKEAGQRKIGRPFQPGQSGNPAGRRPGRNYLVEALRAKVDEETAEKIAGRIIASAKQGSLGAAQFIMRHLPAFRFAMLVDDTKLETASDASKALNQVAAAVLRGDLATCEATPAVAILAAALAGSAGASDVEGLLRRIAELRAIAERRSEAADGSPLPWEGKPDAPPAEQT